MATEEAAAPAAPPAEEAPPAAPAEAGAGAGEQEEKVEEEQEPAEVLPPPCFDLDEHKLKVCSRYTIQYPFWLFHHQATSQSQSPASSGKVFPLCVLFPPVFSSVFAFPCVCFSLCVLFPVCAFPKCKRQFNLLGSLRANSTRLKAFVGILKLFLKPRLTTSKESMQCLMTWKRLTGLQTFARWPFPLF